MMIDLDWINLWLSAGAQGKAWEAQAHALANQRDIGTLATTFCDVAQSLIKEIKTLQNNVEKVSTITQGMWDILKEQHGYTDDTLVLQLQANARKKKSGNEDPVCPRCGLPPVNAQVSPQCLYCGAMRDKQRDWQSAANKVQNHDPTHP